MAEAIEGGAVSPAQEAILDNLPPLEALQGVKRYPVRVKCAVLAWNTLQEGLQQVEARENPRP